MTPVGIRLSVGTSGSGKTFDLKEDVFAAAREMPVCALDLMAEYTSVPSDLNTKGFTDVGTAIKWLKKQRAGLAIVRVKTGAREAFDRACKWAIKGGSRGVACSEAHMACKNGPDLEPHALIAATQFRHYNIRLFIDTQRLAELHPTLRDQATIGVKIFAVVGPRDLAVIRETWGTDVERNVRECARIFMEGGGIEGPPECKGYYVRANVPPYRIERRGGTERNA